VNPRWFSPWLCLLLLTALARGQDYQYSVSNDWIVLRDGVRLAVTHYIPQPKSPAETFPVLLSMLPYRKDDISRNWALQHYDYFARKGLALARVDIRGTGGSEGELPTREYSEVEIDDAVEVIAALADLPWSNGNIGMWGISWGGFNALQTAMRNPPELKAVLAAHASDDLYMNDVHFNNGSFGVDEYILSINHMTGFMRSPDYAVDADYFSNRFDREPWLFNYLRNSSDSDFWRQGSLKYHYELVQTPVMLINGLYDGYRDTAAAAIANLNVPVQAWLGPWNHSWPDTSSPGPQWQWRPQALAWWQRWLQVSSTPNPGELGGDSEIDKTLHFFLRAGHPPGRDLETVAGDWFAGSWPLPRPESEPQRWYPGANGRLNNALQGGPNIQILVPDPSSGHQLGEWWGDLQPDMRAVDALNLTYDSDFLSTALPVVGQPEVSLRVSADAVKANWIVRLEDVSPSGQVTMVTGGSRNSMLAGDPLALETDQRGEHYLLRVPLHFTTWTFQPGHRIRLVIGNAAFPMIWPSPELRVSSLRFNDPETHLTLPHWRRPEQSTAIDLTAPSPADSNLVAPVSLGPVDWIENRDEVIEDRSAGSVSVIRQSGVAYRMDADSSGSDAPVLETGRYTRHTTQRQNPALTEYEGWMEYRLRLNQNAPPLHYRTHIKLESDARDFYLNIERRLWDESGEIRRRQWSERIPRAAH